MSTSKKQLSYQDIVNSAIGQDNLNRLKKLRDNVSEARLALQSIESVSQELTEVYVVSSEDQPLLPPFPSIDVPLSMALNSGEAIKASSKGDVRKLSVEVTWEPSSKRPLREPEVKVAILEDKIGLRFGGSIASSVRQVFHLDPNVDVEPLIEDSYFVFPKQQLAGKTVHVELSFGDDSIAKFSVSLPV